MSVDGCGVDVSAANFKVPESVLQTARSIMGRFGEDVCYRAKLSPRNAASASSRRAAVTNRRRNLQTAEERQGPGWSD